MYLHLNESYRYSGICKLSGFEGSNLILLYCERWTDIKIYSTEVNLWTSCAVETAIQASSVMSYVCASNPAILLQINIHYFKMLPSETRK
jgi:hypothetical protein